MTINSRTVERNLDRIKRFKLDKLRTETLHFVKVCNENPSAPDGFPTTASGADRTLGGGSRPHQDRDELCDYTTDGIDEHGRPTHELAHLPASSDTSVEQAALTERRIRDDIDMKTNVAVQQIEQAADALELALAKFVECRNLQAKVPEPSKAECWIMRQRADVFEESAHKSDLNGLLDEPRHVCAWVYKFARENGVLPNREQCRARARGDRVMVKA